MGKKTETSSMLCKIVYFDEDSVTDFIQIVAGGKLERTTELLNETNDSGKAEVNGKASVGLGGVLRALVGFEASVSTEASLETSFNSNQMAKNIVKNTILTDFIDLMTEYSSENKENAMIQKFTGFTISAPKESMSYVALISPYLSMLKGGSSIPAGEFNIAIDKLDNTLKNAKGYYEFIGIKDDKKVIFRFNIKSFKNNYKAPDLLKMDISIYAIKVGTSSTARLNFNNEFDIDSVFVKKDNPEYKKEDSIKEDIVDEIVDVYDVLLAGVEIYDR